MGLEFRDILAKQEGWKHFVSPARKKLVPVVIPAAALGYVFYNIAAYFVRNGLAGTLQSNLFLVAVIFLYLWLVLQMFMLSCWIYTMAETYFKKEKPVPEEFRLKRFEKEVE